MTFEKFTKRNEAYDIQDYAETSYYPLLLNLPSELLQKHLEIIETRKLNDHDAHEYLIGVMEKRKEATTISEISDSNIRGLFEENKAEAFHAIETSVFNSPDIGAGQTARVKRFNYEARGEPIPMAIKYLLNPTTKTLSAAAEHDMLHEVERIHDIEEIEKPVHLQYIGVPHPYFHHKTEHLQCYGMELIDGVTLQEIRDDAIPADMMPILLNHFAHIDENELYKEIEVFLNRMHTYCLHGDIKPANIMVSATGKFYLIDFGQSVLVSEIPDKAREQFENLKDTEVAQTKYIVQLFLKKLQKLETFTQEAA